MCINIFVQREKVVPKYTRPGEIRDGARHTAREETAADECFCVRDTYSREYHRDGGAQMPGSK